MHRQTILLTLKTSVYGSRKHQGRHPEAKPSGRENEQFSDIILILDKMELLLQAVTKLDKNGRYESVAAKEENRNSFLKLDATRTCSRVSSRTSGAS